MKALVKDAKAAAKAAAKSGQATTPDDAPPGALVEYAENTRREPSLHFQVPDLKYLHIRLHEGVVPIMDFDGLCDPFLHVDTGLMQWKSEISKNTLCPVWRQEVILGCYNLQHLDDWGLKLPEELQGDLVNMTVYNYNPARDRRIGFIRLRFRDLPGYDTDDIVEPPTPHWFEADRHFGILTSLVSSDPGKWVTSLMFDKKMKKKTKEQQDKIATIRLLQQGLPVEAEAEAAKAKDKVPGQQIAQAQAERAQKVQKIRALEGGRGEEAEEEEEAGDDINAEEVLKHAHELCSIKAQVWFDNTYTAAPLPIVGQLVLRLQHIELERREFGAPRAPLVILNYGRHWVRMPTVFGNVQNEFNQEFTFGVREPADVLTLAIFDDVSDSLIGTAPKFLGLLRVRPCCLSSNTWHQAALPLYQRFRGAVRQRGKVTLAACLRLPQPLLLLVTMFKPMLKDMYYYFPLDEFKSDLMNFKVTNFETPIRVEEYNRLLEMLGMQEPVGEMQWQAKVVKRVMERPTPDLDQVLLRAHVDRLKECFKVVVRFIDYLDYIVLWTNFKESLAVNLFLVFLICYIEWVPTALLLALLLSFSKGMLRRRQGRVIAPMESELFGKVVSKLDTDVPAEVSDDEEFLPLEEEPEGELGPLEELRQLKAVAIRVQEGLGLGACIMERVEALPRFMDPRVSGLMLGLFAALIPALCYVPLKLVISFAVLFVLRHPVLRDPIPPPPVNLVYRLPSRRELLLPKES